MKDELEQLRISKEHKARHVERSPWPWLFLLLLLTAGGIAAGWYYREANAPLPVQVLRVRLPDATSRPSELVLLNATGYVIAAHKIELASKVIGRVAWVGVEMGDKVEKGQVLVRLEDDEYKARVLQQTGQLESAKARLAELRAGPRREEIAQADAQYEKARVEMENAELAYHRLLEAKTARSKAEIDDAEANMKAQRAQAEYARQQVEMMKAGTRQEQIDAQQATVTQLDGVLAQAKLDLDNTVIHSPINATVLERNVEVGEFVTTGFVGDRGAKGYVVSIADLSDLLVELDISQNDFAKVTDNQPCWITTDAYPDRKYKGRVDLISPVANRQKATVQVRVKVLEPDGLLKPDMNATVSFLSRQPGETTSTQPSSTPPTLRIPTTAVREGAVFVVENDRAVRRPVTLGLTTASGEVEIKKGLTPGDELILHPPATLKEHDPIAPQP